MPPCSMGILYDVSLPVMYFGWLLSVFFVILHAKLNDCLLFSVFFFMKRHTMPIMTFLKTIKFAETSCQRTFIVWLTLSPVFVYNDCMHNFHFAVFAFFTLQWVALGDISPHINGIQTSQYRQIAVFADKGKTL